MERVRTLSQARSELFALFDEVTAHAGRKIVLRHRGSEHEVVLVRRDYLRLLEQARDAAVSGSFSLFGSATLNGDLEQALAAIRAEAAGAFEHKIAAAGGEDAGRKGRETPASQRSAVRRTTGRGKRQ
jgi:hypothetical protein